MTYALTHRKICRTFEQAEKERATLRMLQTSSLRHLTPKLVEIQQDPLVVEMLHIKGVAPDPANIGVDFFDQLGTTLRQIHHLRPCTVFGAFDARFNMPNCYVMFGNFLEAQIKKWILRHGATPGSYLHAYSVKIRQEFNQLCGYFDGCTSIFCHGDIKFENLITQNGNLVGIIDWEHSGAYCLEWELRKFPSILTEGWQLERLLTSYGDVAMTDKHTITSAIRFLNAADLLGFLYWCRVRRLQTEENITIKHMHSYLNPKEVS